MIDRIINTKNTKGADVIILGAPYEGSVSFGSGTEEGPKKIIECLDNYLELFDIDLKCEPAKKIKTAYLEIKNLQKLNTQKAIKKIKEEYVENVRNKKLGVLLGGEHSISLGALQAVAEKEDAKKITIVQIDAHQDLRDDNSDYEEKVDKFAHSCVMRRAHELGYNLVQIGIRTFSKYEYEYWQKNKKNITVFKWNEKMPKISEILKAIKTDKIYLSIDVDGFDPSYMPGTGTPVQGGLDWNYGIDLLKKITKEKELIGMDIVEVAPQKESSLTEFGASLILYKIISQKFRKLFS